jgi:hypothetical protein
MLLDRLKRMQGGVVAEKIEMAESVDGGIDAEARAFRRANIGFHNADAIRRCQNLTGFETGAVAPIDGDHGHAFRQQMANNP